MANNGKRKCIICDTRPAIEDCICNNCSQAIAKERRARQPRKPDLYLAYKGGVVGLFRSGSGNYRCEALNISAKRLPKTRTLNLNRYCEGYDRKQIKAFKRAVLSLALVTQ